MSVDALIADIANAPLIDLLRSIRTFKSGFEKLTLIANPQSSTMILVLRILAKSVSSYMNTN